MKLHVSDSSSVHHQEIFTVHSAMAYVIQVCRQLSLLFYEVITKRLTFCHLGLFSLEVRVTM
jgi:hypothetical protein